ncbi:uncharacterized protein MONOS_17211 [Monocercomonoides exilis]|uniref:uncharacterized protein n=1 Tax=Monocercomonoides exilis TaxID=2049356 RepID=UPI00355A9551|nr:hypothetical protein MONOS_17211 [Monocercomonoides exilis]
MWKRSVTYEEKAQNSTVLIAVFYLFRKLIEPELEGSNRCKGISGYSSLSKRKNMANVVSCKINEYFMLFAYKLKMHFYWAEASNSFQRVLKDLTMNMHICRNGHGQWHFDGFYGLEEEKKGKRSLKKWFASKVAWSKIKKNEFDEFGKLSWRIQSTGYSRETCRTF